MALLLALLIKLGRYSGFNGGGCCLNGMVAPLAGKVGCQLGDPVGDLVGNLVGEVVGDLVDDMVGSFNCAWLL